ncbi:MAG: class II aldolase/adducin family protein [Acholeplasmataceae bacterium]|nr:class II aldolase/adducin family protein [Acholeplasmataceae bacterium]
MKFSYMHPAEQIVLLINRIYTKQMTTTSGGNLSILDDEGDIWITPSGIDKGTLTTADICQIKPDGTVIGKHRPSVETPFHKCVYKARPDVKAVLHAHPHSLVSFSLVGQVPNTKIIPSPHLVCGEIGFADYDLPGSEQLGQKISDQFAKGHNVVVMENHGVVTCADNLFDAFKIFETLERCAELNIIAKQLGEATVLNDEDIELNMEKGKILPEEFLPIDITSQEKKARKEMCALIHRAYDQNLFTSTMGTFSQRLDQNNFLITPYGIDRKYLEPEEIVLIHNGLREKGKHPSRSVDLHKLIYDQHPEVNAIVIAHPTHMMAFGITKTPLDPRTIPESYIMIRDLVRVPYGLSILNPQALTDMISPSTPVILAENDFVLTVGSTLINAFDRLEVAEFTATTILNASKIGSIDPISQDRIDEIDIAFNLK